MCKVVRSLTELIGGTPMLEPVRYLKEQSACGRLLLKLEYFNPLGSVKDRVALAMVEDAERRGQLRPGGIIVEPTSGNTGIGLAFVGLVKGYREVHRRTTGPEILADTGGKVDIFVAGVGTGGTLTGIGEALKEADPAVRVVAVEPSDSPVLSQGRSGAHKLQGLGAGFCPPVLNRRIYDEVMTVRNDEAYDACRAIARTEGLLLGISSGAALYAATQLAKRVENRDKTIVAVMPDTGERYLSANLFGE